MAFQPPTFKEKIENVVRKLTDPKQPTIHTLGQRRGDSNNVAINCINSKEFISSSSQLHNHSQIEQHSHLITSQYN